MLEVDLVSIEKKTNSLVRKSWFLMNKVDDKLCILLYCKSDGTRMHCMYLPNLFAMGQLNTAGFPSGCQTKAKEINLPYYISIPKRREQMNSCLSPKNINTK